MNETRYESKKRLQLCVAFRTHSDTSGACPKSVCSAFRRVGIDYAGSMNEVSVRVRGKIDERRNVVVLLFLLYSWRKQSIDKRKQCTARLTCLIGKKHKNKKNRLRQNQTSVELRIDFFFVIFITLFVSMEGFYRENAARAIHKMQSQIAYHMNKTVSNLIVIPGSLCVIVRVIVIAVWRNERTIDRFDRQRSECRSCVRSSQARAHRFSLQSRLECKERRMIVALLCVVAKQLTVRLVLCVSVLFTLANNW
jgi:hypothetical protein